MLDTTSTDAGASWETVSLHAPFNPTLRGEFGVPEPGSGALLAMDNRPQIARSEDGEHIFYAWATSLWEQVGFAESANLAPQLYVGGMRLSDGALYGPKVLTYDDPAWDGRALFPSMAPTVLEVDDCFIPPIVLMDLVSGDQLESTRGRRGGLPLRHRLRGLRRGARTRLRRRGRGVVPTAAASRRWARGAGVG